MISGQASTMKGVAHKLQEIPERREDFYWIGAVHQQHWGKLKKGRLGGGCGEDMVMHTYNSSIQKAERKENCKFKASLGYLTRPGLKNK